MGLKMNLDKQPQFDFSGQEVAENENVLKNMDDMLKQLFTEPVAGMPFLDKAISGSSSFSEAIVEKVISDDIKAAAAEGGLTEDEVLVEEYITLHSKIEELDVANMQKRMGEIKKQLQSIANEKVAADELAVFTAPSGKMVYSPRANVKVFNDPGTLLSDLVDKFGMEAVQKVVKIGVGELSKLLSQNEMAEYFTEEPGSRSLKEVVVQSQKG